MGCHPDSARSNSFGSLVEELQANWSRFIGGFRIWKRKTSGRPVNHDKTDKGPEQKEFAMTTRIFPEGFLPLVLLLSGTVGGEVIPGR